MRKIRKSIVTLYPFNLFKFTDMKKRIIQFLTTYFLFILLCPFCSGKKDEKIEYGDILSTFSHEKVEPKVSARHLRRNRTTVLTERARKTALFRTPAPGVRTVVRFASVSGAMRIMGSY